MSSFSIFSFSLPLSLFVIVWGGYRFGGSFSLASSLFAGFWLSFYSPNPNLTLLAYIIVGLMTGMIISILNNNDRESRKYSLTIIGIALLIIYGSSLLPVLGAFGLVQALVSLLIATSLVLVLWIGIILMVDPRT